MSSVGTNPELKVAVKDCCLKTRTLFTCILSCCQSCSFCRRVVAKERRNSRTSNVNKVCERCFLCRSLEFCSKCHKCPTCCTKSSCRVKIARVLGEMGSPRCQPQGGISPQRGLHPALPVQTSPNQKANYNKLLCRSPQEQLPVGGIASAVKQERCRIGPKSTVPGVLQPVVPCTKAQQPVASYLRSEQTKQLSENTVIQNGDPRDNSDLPPGRGVGHLHRLQRRVLPRTNKQPVQEVHAFSHPRQSLSVQSTTLWPVHSSHGVHCHSQRGQMAGNEKGYKDPPVPRRLVGQSYLPPGLSSTNSNPSQPLSRAGLASKRGEIRTGTQTSFQFLRLPVRFDRRQGQTHHRTLGDPTNQDTGDVNQPSVSGPESNVPGRITDCHRKVSTLGQVTYETHTVAPQKQLESTRKSGEDHPHSKDTPPPPEMVAGGKQCYHRSTLTPSSTCAADLYRRIKRRVERSLKRAHGKGKLVNPRKQTAHKLPRVKGSSHSYRQHHGGSLHKQGGGNEVGAPVCLTLENTDLVHQKSSNRQSSTYSRPSERDSRQAIQIRSNHSNRMVPQSRDFSSYMQPVAQTPSGLSCHKVQQQASIVCLTVPRPPGLGSGCSQPVMGWTGPLLLPTSSHLGQSGGEAAGLPLQQNHSDCLRVAQHALVLGSSGDVQSNPTMSAQHTKLSVSAIQPGPSQKPVKSEPTCLAPRASAIKEQGFSEAVAARIEAPQRGSTRSVYEAKWTIFTKWCLSNQVDFRAPPLKAIADFLCTYFRTRSCNLALLMATDQPLLTNWAMYQSMSAKMRISPVSWIASIEIGPRAGGVYPPGTCPWFYTS